MASRSLPDILSMTTDDILVCIDEDRSYSDSYLVDPYLLSPESTEDLSDSSDSISLHNLTELIFGSGDNRIVLSVVRLYDPRNMNSGDAFRRLQEFDLDDQDDSLESSGNETTLTGDSHSDEQQPSSPEGSTCIDKRPILEPPKTERPIVSKMSPEDLKDDQAAVTVLVGQQVEQCPITPAPIYTKVQVEEDTVLTVSYTNCSYLSGSFEDVTPVGDGYPNDQGRCLEPLPRVKFGRIRYRP